MTLSILVALLGLQSIALGQGRDEVPPRITVCEELPICLPNQFPPDCHECFPERPLGQWPFCGCTSPPDIPVDPGAPVTGDDDRCQHAGIFECPSGFELGIENGQCVCRVLQFQTP